MSEDLCGQYGVTCEADAGPLRDSLLNVAGLSELFKALSDETRIKILHLVSQRELCVCDLAFLLEMSLPAISHHLRFLKALRLVKSRKDGKNVFYSLDDDHVLTLIQQAKEHYIERT
ncbi:MAG: metalloregulator ArsR/SmtB family transcription factor [Spirochaetaceae bacterium]|nr:metalloregulator ArsR/SmtB family transcription factor [Spirochaetaceae bacterium]